MSTQTLPLVASAPVRRWYALFVPSLADLFFAAVIVWVFAAGQYGWYGLLMDGGTGTHIRYGDYILAHHAVPTRDFLSFSRVGQEWYPFEWLTQITFSALHSFAGLKGVVLFAGVVIAATFTVVLLFALWRRANIVIALLLTLMAVNASYIHFHARPHVFTLLLTAVAMWLIAADRRRRSGAIWLLIPTTVLWTNLHGGFLILFPILGLLALGSLVESFLWSEIGARGKSDAIRYGLLGLACAAGSLVNPYGVKLHLFIQQYLRSDEMRNGVQELLSPSFRGESMLHYMAMLLAAIAITGPLLGKHRLIEVLWLWFMAYSSLVSVRHVPLFMIVAAPILAEEFTALWNRWAQSQPTRSLARTLDAISAQFQTNAIRVGVWGPLLVLGLSLSHTSNWPDNFFDGVFPVKIVEAHADEIATSRVFTSDGWAGYLVYRNYPRQRVFMDDRHPYYSGAIIEDYLKLSGGKYEWRELLERYRFDLVLCTADSPLASLMKTHSGWRTVEDDGKNVLFRKTS